MLDVKMLQFWTLLFGGVLAGFEIAVHYGLGSLPRSLTVASQIMLRQAMVLRLRVLAPCIFFPALAFGIGLTVHERHSNAIWLHGAAIALYSSWIVVRILRTVPVNSATLEWNPDTPPADWRELVERTERFHVIAAWASVVAFVCFLLPAVQHR